MNPGFSPGAQVAAERIKEMGYEVEPDGDTYRVTNPPWQGKG